MQLAENTNLQKILIDNKDFTPVKSIFSDYACRVNSNGDRKVRVIVVSGKPG